MYKVSSTSLFIYFCTSSLTFCFTWHKTWCSEVPSASADVGTKMENIWQRILHLFWQMENFCWFGYMYLNWLGKYNGVYKIAFQTHWKETFFVPTPLQKFTSFRPPISMGRVWINLLELHNTNQSVVAHSSLTYYLK